MKKLMDESEIVELKTRRKLVFMFTKESCQDCDYVKEFIPAIEGRFSDFTFVEVDADQFKDFAQELDIDGLPSFVVFNEYQEAGRFATSERKSPDEIEDFLTQVNDNIWLENQ